jgi:hypothetical protein
VTGDLSSDLDDYCDDKSPPTAARQRPVVAKHTKQKVSASATIIRS